MISLDERGLLSLIESAVSIDCIIFFVKTQASSHWDKIIVEHVLAYGASSIQIRLKVGLQTWFIGHGWNQRLVFINHVGWSIS